MTNRFFTCNWRFLRVAVPIVAFLAPHAGSAFETLQQSAVSATWLTAWGTSQQALGTAMMTNATVRMIARVTVPGEAVRVRLDNTFGTGPLAIGKAYVGQRTRGAALVPGSNRQLFFNRSVTVTIPPGGSVVSDPVKINIPGGQDLAVSVHIPQANVRPSQHSSALVTSYSSPDGSGDVAADEAGTPFTGSTSSMFWVKAIDVLSSSATGMIVAFGDSITDGTCSTLDAHNRWEDWLATRLVLDAESRGAKGAYKAVVNEGIGGNTVTREKLEPPPDSPPGIERIERDVFSHAGVTDVVLFMGTNDIRRGASAAQVIAGTEDLIKRVKDRGLKVIGATIIPRHNVAPSGANTGWNAAKTEIRQTVNQWIRSRASFDGVIDFDKVVRDPANPDRIYAPFNCDDIHPTPLGYFEMGKSVSLGLFGSGLARGPSR